MSKQDIGTGYWFNKRLSTSIYVYVYIHKDDLQQGLQTTKGFTEFSVYKCLKQKRCVVMKAK